MPEKSSKKPRTQKRAPRKVDARYLENAALYYLQRYATSSENLKNVLRRKVRRSCLYHGTNPDDFLPLVDALAARYEQAGLLNDQTYAEGRIAALRRQGLSRQAITQKMSLKGIAPSMIADVLAHLDETAEGENEAGETAEVLAARRLARRKRIGPWRRGPAPDPKALQKEMAALARAGFSYEVARRALDAPASDDDLAL